TGEPRAVERDRRRWQDGATECAETKLYKGPCLELICVAACLLEMHQGGHCKGSWFWGRCLCFTCS
uniref:Knottin scorpion toxin-like domain-containing protein n=1 Tax=Setaria italica TaxID=4555 RepID=K3YE14_SETIT